MFTIVDFKQTLMQSTTFKILLVVGVITVLTSGVVEIVFRNLDGECSQDIYCNGGSTCSEHGTTYCCQSPNKYDTYTCGKHHKNCYVYSYQNFVDCNGFYIAQMVMISIELICLVSMMVIAHKHRKRQEKQQVFPYNNQIVYLENYQQQYQPPQHQQQLQPQINHQQYYQPMPNRNQPYSNLLSNQVLQGQVQINHSVSSENILLR